MAQNNIFNIVRKIQKESKNAESYNTGLIGEQIIVSSYQSMDVEKLEKMRYIINKIIKKKKEMKRVNNATNNINGDIDL